MRILLAVNSKEGYVVSNRSILNRPSFQYTMICLRRKEKYIVRSEVYDIELVWHRLKSDIFLVRSLCNKLRRTLFSDFEEDAEEHPR
jgi:hypothetical protein